MGSLPTNEGLVNKLGEDFKFVCCPPPKAVLVNCLNQDTGKPLPPWISGEVKVASELKLVLLDEKGNQGAQLHHCGIGQYAHQSKGEPGMEIAIICPFWSA